MPSGSDQGNYVFVDGDSRPYDKNTGLPVKEDDDEPRAGFVVSGAFLGALFALLLIIGGMVMTFVGVSAEHGYSWGFAILGAEMFILGCFLALS